MIIEEEFGNDYYAYVVVKENAYNEPVAAVDDSNNSLEDSKLIKGLLITLAVIIVLIVGRQIVKFRKRVRAA